jgi:phosphatidylglycerophosphatase C
MSSQKEKKVIAAFDFDGTLTYRDSLISFLKYVVGPSRTATKLFANLPSFIGFALNMTSRQELKEALLKDFLGGMPLELIQIVGKDFALGPLKSLLRSEGMQRLAWHQNQGHSCVLISANLDVYLKPWAEGVGFQKVICSSLATDAQGIVTGKLYEQNCRGSEKTRRLKEWTGAHEEYLLYAYGDSDGDKELLQMADFPFYRSFS